MKGSKDKNLRTGIWVQGRENLKVKGGIDLGD